MTSIYSDGEYLKNNESWHTEDSVWKAQQIAGIIDRNDISFHSMLEVGCGAGAILNALAFRYDDEKNSFEGYDISPRRSRWRRKTMTPASDTPSATPWPRRAASPSTSSS